MYLREREKDAIKYMNNIGATDAIGIIKKVGDDGKVDESRDYYEYGTVCLANELQKSDKKLILSSGICERLTKIYKENKNEISFVLGGYVSGENIYIKAIYLQKEQSGLETRTATRVDFVQKKVLKTKLKYPQKSPIIFSAHNHTLGTSLHKDEEKICNNFSLLDMASTKELSFKLMLSEGALSHVLKECEVGTFMINHIGDLNVTLEEDGKLLNINKIYFKDKDGKIKPVEEFKDLSNNRTLGVFTNYEKNYKLDKLEEHEAIIDTVLNKYDGKNKLFDLEM